MEDWEREYEEHQAARKKAKEEKEEQMRTAWAQDAQAAWDEGRSFYQPIIPAKVVTEAMTKMNRGIEAEEALHAITAVGWRLHSWAVAGGGAAPNEYGIGVYAHPLFVRE